MAIPEPGFTVGIEEEYLLVDKATRDLCNDTPETMVLRAVVDMLVEETRPSPA